MKTCILAGLLLFSLSASTQRSRDEKLQDSVFAWASFNPLKPGSYPRSFSAYQTRLPNIFNEWMKKSYIPIGAIDNSFAIAEPNKKEEVQPYGVGIYTEMWLAQWDKAGKKVIRTPHSANPVQIITNHIIDAMPIPMLSIPGRPVFMRRSPDAEKAFAGWPYGEKKVKAFNLHNDPKLSNYIVQYFGCEADLCQPSVAVYITPNKRLPIRQLSRGEVLDFCEQAIPAETIAAKKKLKSSFGHRPQSLQEEYKRFEETVLPKWKANIQQLREMYKGELHKPAETGNINGIEMTNLFNGNDIFQVSGSRMFGIYTFEDGILEKSKADTPLWLCISWMPADDLQASYAREIHRSMKEHFNFAYAYDYFFNSTAVKGKPYTALNTELQKSNIAALHNKKEHEMPALKLPAGIYFFDDFSANAPGSKPKGWYDKNVGEPNVISTPEGLSGNWVNLRTTSKTFLPTTLKKPFPTNFKMEFDVACSPFSSNTGGALLLNINNREFTENGDMKDAANPVNIDFNIKAGHVKFTVNNPAQADVQATWKGMPGNIRYGGNAQHSIDFTNQKNKVHVTIIKKDNLITAYVDNTELAYLDKYKQPIAGYNVLPQGTILTSFRFQNTTSGKENHIYISNIKITGL